jgi:glycosyltransferase involved in cell wall biosynthesis
MKIIYCIDTTIPSDLANAFQVAQMCDAFVRLGHEVTIVAPARFDVQHIGMKEKYGISSKVLLVYLPYLFDSPLVRRSRILRTCANLIYRYHLRRWLRGQSCDVLYTRVPFFLASLIGTRHHVILELHALPSIGKQQFIRHCNACWRVVCLTSYMKETLQQWGVSSDRLLVEGDAVDLERFAHPPSKWDAREKYGLPQDAFVIGYIGRLRTLGLEKGVDTIIRGIARFEMAPHSIAFIVGGPSEEVMIYQQLAASLGLDDTRVVFTGQIPTSQIVNSLACCDVLAMPFPDQPHFRNNMSPLKLFEYMAIGRPIIASDLPTIRAVLSDECAYYCVPGSTDSFVQALESSFMEDSSKKVSLCMQLVQEFTWVKRAKRILYDIDGKSSVFINSSKKLCKTRVSN